MAASSVTGVGQGAAGSGNKGSDHMRLDVNNLVGPRLVDCGQATLTSGTPSTCNVPFTKTLSSATGYYAHVVAVGATSGSAVDLAVSQVATTGFTVTGPNSSTATFNWSIVYNPNGGAVATGNVS